MDTKEYLEINIVGNVSEIHVAAILNAPSVQRLIQNLGAKKKKGQLLVGFSSDLGNQELLDYLAKQAGLNLEIVAEKEIKEKDTLKFELLRGTYLNQN